MPLIRFVREARDVECYPGENLREVALREGIALYGIKGVLGNCGGCGQCITCFVEVPEGTSAAALSPRTGVEDQKLRNRPPNWRLACQALVQESLVVLTKPQVGPLSGSGASGVLAATLANNWLGSQRKPVKAPPRNRGRALRAMKRLDRSPLAGDTVPENPPSALNRHGNQRSWLRRQLDVRVGAHGFPAGALHPNQQPPRGLITS